MSDAAGKVVNLKGEAFSADPVFFTKNQLAVGSKLLYLGRTDPGSVWEIKKIHSHYFVYSKYGVKEIRHRLVKSPLKHFDLIFLKRITNTPRLTSTGKKMSSILELNFSYLSYSAIWRVEP